MIDMRSMDSRQLHISMKKQLKFNENKCKTKKMNSLTTGLA